MDVNFKADLEERLRGEAYLDDIPGDKRKQKIDHAILQYEENLKRDFESHVDPPCYVNFKGLRANAAKGFFADQMQMTGHVLTCPQLA